MFLKQRAYPSERGVLRESQSGFGRSYILEGGCTVTIRERNVGFFAGGVANLSLDLELLESRARPHDGGGSRAADAPGRPAVGEHEPEGSPPKTQLMWRT